MTDDILPALPLLDRNDLTSPTWVKLRKHMEARQQALRLRIEHDLDPIATATLRGELKVYRSLLALAKSEPPQVVADEGHDE